MKAFKAPPAQTEGESLLVCVVRNQPSAEVLRFPMRHTGCSSSVWIMFYISSRQTVWDWVKPSGTNELVGAQFVFCCHFVGFSEQCCSAQIYDSLRHIFMQSCRFQGHVRVWRAQEFVLPIKEQRDYLEKTAIKLTLVALIVLSDSAMSCFFILSFILVIIVNFSTMKIAGNAYKNKQINENRSIKWNKPIIMELIAPSLLFLTSIL